MILSQDEQNVVLLFVFIVLKKNLLFIFWGDKRDEQSIHFFLWKKKKKREQEQGNKENLEVWRGTWSTKGAEMTTNISRSRSSIFFQIVLHENSIHR